MQHHTLYSMFFCKRLTSLDVVTEVADIADDAGPQQAVARQPAKHQQHGVTCVQSAYHEQSQQPGAAVRSCQQLSLELSHLPQLQPLLANQRMRSS